MFDNILQTIGNTPVIRLNRLAPPGVNLFVKVEAFNPMGSVKDRMALAVIEAAEADGSLRPGQTVVEATSGNTGIGLAMVCAVKGYPLVLTMSETFSIERRKILRFLGAKVVLTPAELKGSGMVAKAAELAAAHDWFLVRQFENPANAEVHVRTTAQEILAEFGPDRPLHYFVTGFGTGGTFNGVSRVLKQASPDTCIVVCEPDNSPVLRSGIAQARAADGTPTASHPAFRPHLMQGWAPDFIPWLVQEAMDAGRLDHLLPIDGEQALEVTRELARQEGIFCGVSGGATVAGALQMAQGVDPGSNILAMLPDTGERYLSTPVFADIAVDMSEEEMAIASSTPGARFDAPRAAGPATPAAPAAVPPAADQAAQEFFTHSIADPDHPVVIYSLTWCEFCWAAKKLFDRLGIPYRPVNLDSVEFETNELGSKLRAVLLQATGRATIPQIWIAGTHIGGATDLFKAYEDGRLASLLEPRGIIPAPQAEDFVAASLLPGWLHHR